MYLQITPSDNTTVSVFTQPDIIRTLREFPYGDELKRLSYQNESSDGVVYKTEMWFNNKGFSVVQ